MSAPFPTFTNQVRRRQSHVLAAPLGIARWLDEEWLVHVTIPITCAPSRLDFRTDYREET